MRKGYPVSVRADAPPQPTGDFNIQQGYDLQGQDYYKFTTKGDYAECDCQCGRDQKCLAYTWVKPGVQGADAVCWLKSGVPNPTQNSNCVSGVRKVLPAMVKVEGVPAHLAAVTPPAPASPSGTNKMDISSAKNYTFSAEQKSGSASASLPAILNVSGQWKGSNGLVYDIRQTGNRFEWTVNGKNEKADGVIKGNNVSVSWKRESLAGTLEGKIRAIDSTGKATQIDWNNGMRFSR